MPCLYSALRGNSIHLAFQCLQLASEVLSTHNLLRVSSDQIDFEAGDNLFGDLVHAHGDGYLRLTSNPAVAYNRIMSWDKGAIFKALSDSTRRLMLDELSERNEQTLYELSARLITKHDLSISRQAIAKHLAALEGAGLVRTERKGKFRVIVFNKEPLKHLLKGWIE